MHTYTTSTENRTKARTAMRGMAARGEFPGCAPVGYRNAIEGYKKCIVIDEEKARLVRLAFGMAASGERPLRDILAEMTSRGLLSRNGKPMGVSSLWKMLGNPFYAGLVRYGDIVAKGAHEPLVSSKAFAIVQSRLERRNRSRRNARKTKATNASAPT